MKLKALLYFFAFPTIIILSHCTQHIAGTGHEGEAMVQGHVYDSSGTGVKGMNVYLLPADYNPVHDTAPSYQTITNTKGYFTLDSVLPGKYVLNGNDSSEQLHLYHPGIVVFDSGLNTGDDTIKSLVKVTILTPDSLYGKNNYLIVSGTNFFTHVDSCGLSKLQAPRGVVDIIHVHIEKNVIVSKQIISENFSINKTDTIDLINLLKKPVISDHDSGIVNVVYTFHIKNYNSELYYKLCWGNGDTSSFFSDSFISNTWSLPGVYPVCAQARKLFDSSIILSPWSDPLVVTIRNTDTLTDSITPPTKPVGSQNVSIDTAFEYSCKATFAEKGDTLEYQFSWGDGTLSEWSVDSSQWHSWSNSGSYYISVRVRNKRITTNISQWSDSLAIVVSGYYARFNFFRKNTLNDTLHYPAKKFHQKAIIK